MRYLMQSFTGHPCCYLLFRLPFVYLFLPLGRASLSLFLYFSLPVSTFKQELALRSNLNPRENYRGGFVAVPAKLIPPYN